MDNALGKAGRPQRHVVLAIIERSRPAAELGFKAVRQATRGLHDRAAVAGDLDRTLDQARRNHRAGLGVKANHTRGHVAPGRDAQPHVLGMAWREQIEVDRAVRDAELRAARRAVCIKAAAAQFVGAGPGDLNAGAVARDFDGDQDRDRHRMAVGIGQRHVHRYRRLAVGRGGGACGQIDTANRRGSAVGRLTVQGAGDVALRHDRLKPGIGSGLGGAHGVTDKGQGHHEARQRNARVHCGTSVAAGTVVGVTVRSSPSTAVAGTGVSTGTGAFSRVLTMAWLAESVPSCG